MKLSIIVPVLNSHEVLRRQFLHFERIGIPEDTEIIVVDDGSDPPLEYSGSLPVTIHYTNDKRPWTWALARNAGARIAKGEFLLMFDLDHIADRPLIDAARSCTYDKIQFMREFGVLLPDGTLTQDIPTLIEYGFDETRLKNRGLTLTPTTNSFIMRRDTFFTLGCYREDLVERPYPQGEDRLFKKVWGRALAAGLVTLSPHRPVLYMFPNGKVCKGGDVDTDPKGLFHTLSRKTSKNYWHRRWKEKHNGHIG
jgi:glycosyltransferase involved in cell wall biosynthesis